MSVPARFLTTPAWDEPRPPGDRVIRASIPECLMRYSLLLLSAALASGCSKPERADQPAEAVTVTRDGFQTLRTLQGTWRGLQSNGSQFYESYVFLDDTTIRSFGYPDSTFAQAEDSSTIALREGHVTTKGGPMAWLATRFDSHTVRFDPVQEATNSFTWTFHSRDAWTAQLDWRDSTGIPMSRTYQMERLGP